MTRWFLLLFALLPAALPASPAAPAVATVVLESDKGYPDAAGRLVVDVLERDYAYVTVILQDARGRPVRGVQPAVTAAHGTRIDLLQPVSDASGIVELGILGRRMGEERITVSVGKARAELVLNVVSLQAAGYKDLDRATGALSWDLLQQAQVRYSAKGIASTFPPAVAALDGKVVRMAGFMMPLEPEEKQRRFVLASVPPSCFFHVPGGPAGAVEVLAPRGVAISWDPLLLEGRLELQHESDMGVVYRLRDVKLLPMP